jgi:hypothetical protein
MRIASLLVSALALFAVAACGKSTCEKYADMEVKCGNYPADEKQITRDLAQGFCMAADSDDDPAAQEMAAHFKAEAECAKQHSDCVAYKACTDAIK